MPALRSLRGTLAFIFLAVCKLCTAQTDQRKEESNPKFFLCFVRDGACASTRGFLCDKGCYTVKNQDTYLFAKNCKFIDKKSGRAITPKYICIYDRRNESLRYLKLKNERGYEYVKTKKVIEPKANHEMFFVIIAKDTGYHVQVETEDRFGEYEEQFAKVIQDANPSTKSSESSDTEASIGTSDNNEEVVPHAFEKLPLRTKLNSLSDALGILNSWYPDSVIIQGQYHSDLECIRVRIGTHLQVKIKRADSLTFEKLIIEAESLSAGLREKAGGTSQNDSVIRTIESRYLIFISKQLSTYEVYGTQLKIPDSDVFKISVERKVDNVVAPIMNREFKVSGGFKIDFSAGVFLTGLSVPEFVAQEHFFRYKEATFSVDPTTGTIDTTYTGVLVDTAGYLIHIKNPRMNYAAGFLSHAYVRSGKFANIGLSTGLLVNNDGFQLLIGSSFMLSAKKSRISFSYGVSFGKKKTISPTVDRSIWKESYQDETIYELYSDLPRFISTTDVPTYDRWRRSWYFGLTYNFGTVNIRW